MLKNSGIGKRIKEIREKYSDNQAICAKKLKISASALSQIEKEVTLPSLELLNLFVKEYLCDFFWLVNGETLVRENGKAIGKVNDYLIPESTTSIVNEPQETQLIKQKPRNKVYIVNQDVRAGLLVGFSQENIEPTEVVDIPWLEKGIFYMFNVKGDSMYPTLSSGDKVLARQLEGVQDIQNGQIHVLIHTKGMLVKRLNKSLLKDGFVEYRSDNEEEYHPDKIQVKNVMGLFEVVEAITCNLGNRNKDKELVRLYKQLLTNNGIKF